MPNKTIYVKEKDIPYWERAQTERGASISELFAEFLRTRMTEAPQVEKELANLLEEVREEIDALRKQKAPAGLIGDFKEAEAYIRQVLDAVHTGEMKRARNLWFSAQVCHQYAKRQLVTRKKISQLLQGRS